MKKLLMTTALLGAVGATPAYALLQLSIDFNGTVFSCADGNLSCDVSGGANNVLTIDQTINGVFTQITLTDSSSGQLSLSAANITDKDGTAHSITFIASNTDFAVPVNQIEESGSLTSADQHWRRVHRQILGRCAQHAGGESAQHPRARFCSRPAARSPPIRRRSRATTCQRSPQTHRSR